MQKREERKRKLQPVIISEMQRFRKAYGMSQEEMANKLYISVRAYSDIERGIHFPSALTLALFMSRLDEKEFTKFLLALEDADCQI